MSSQCFLLAKPADSWKSDGLDSTEIKQQVQSGVARHRRKAWKVAQAVHRFSEPPLKEHQSSQLLAEYLRENDFTVTFPYRDLPTAFRAVWGKGKPTLGMLGEYDALPNCGAEEGTWGHGCGHNLLGSAPALGAVVVRDILEQQKIPGRIVYYGCPAEETLVGKVYMAREGAFRDLDACLAWHPSTTTGVNVFGGAAMDSILFEFSGRTAHGSSAHNGRSALDGAMLFDVAVNYLREHVPENIRLHGVIRSGGDAPNVVPAYAKCWYYVRGKDREEVDAVRERVLDCARGAALATGTEVNWTILTTVTERIPNHTLGDLVHQNLRHFGPPRPTKADRDRVRTHLTLKPEFDTTVREGRGQQGRGSTEEDNVSWFTPLGRFQMTCYVKETAGHHRDLAAQVDFPFAERAMAQTAKVFAASALDLFTQPTQLQNARKEFRRRGKGKTYPDLIPKKQKPPSANP